MLLLQLVLSPLTGNPAVPRLVKDDFRYQSRHPALPPTSACTSMVPNGQNVTDKGGRSTGYRYTIEKPGNKRANERETLTPHTHPTHTHPTHTHRPHHTPHTRTAHSSQPASQPSHFTLFPVFSRGFGFFHTGKRSSPSLTRNTKKKKKWPRLPSWCPKGRPRPSRTVLRHWHSSCMGRRCGMRGEELCICRMGEFGRPCSCLWGPKGP